MNFSPRVAFFNQDQFELMRTRVFDLLDQRGVKMDHPEVLQILDKAGAQVDSDTQMVRFSKSFLDEQLQRAPKNVILAGRTEQNNLAIPNPDGTFHTRTNTGGAVLDRT